MSSDSRAEVVRVGPVRKHPDADTLGVTTVLGDYPVVFKLQDFPGLSEGDLIGYVPVDMILPAGPEWDFLGPDRRVKARKFRGIFSMGLPVPLSWLKGTYSAWEEGIDLTAVLDVKKYEEPDRIESSSQGAYEEDEPDTGLLPKYTDVENMRRYSSLLQEGEEVEIDEKIHGESIRVAYDWTASRVRVSSHARWKRQSAASQYWLAAERGNMVRAAAIAPGVGFFGEAYGRTGGFPYGTNRRVRGLAFDAIDTKSRRYLDRDEFTGLCLRLDVPRAPVLYRGPWSAELRELAEGPSALDPSHVREGIVVRPLKERYHPRLGRVILKLHGQGFLLKQGKAKTNVAP